MRKMVEMFDCQGKPTDDPRKAARTVTTILDGERVVERILGKPLIFKADANEENE